MRIIVPTSCLLLFACDLPGETPTPSPPYTNTELAPPALDSSIPLRHAVAEGSTLAEPRATPLRLVGESKMAYEGTWTITDAQGQLFDILFRNGQAVTNWVKGPAGARGERGYWRADQQRLTIVYSNGCTDIIEPSASEFSDSRYRRGRLGRKAGDERSSQAAGECQLALIGVWRLNKEPDGSHLYIALQSNGNAISTINGMTGGKWTPNENGALCEWPDGWIDQIERGTGGWQKRSWIGSESSAPADLSLATRVGETRFSVEP